MASIQPFKGIFYNSALTGNLDSLITQPYGFITSEELDHSLKKSPYNIIRLEYGTAGTGDDETENRYSRAAKTFQKWIERDVLRIAEQKSIYLYEQLFNLDGNNYTRHGVIAALGLEPYSSGVVLPHELTLFGPKKDHRKMLQHVQANIGPIFTVFPDVENQIEVLFNHCENLEPLVNFTDETGLTHRLWPVREGKKQAAFTAYMAPHSLLIADGHHRYTSALKFFQANKGKQPGSGFILAALFDINDPGVLMLPTHRLVWNMTADQKAILKQIINSDFTLLDRGDPRFLNKNRYLNELEDICREKCGMGWITKEKACLIIHEKAGGKGKANMPVSILHERLFKPALKTPDSYRNSGNAVTYTPDFNTVCKAVINGEADAAFIVNSIAVNEIYLRAKQGHFMPQKTTFFYPKLPNGLILYHMELSSS